MKIHRKCVPLFYIHFEKYFFGKNHSSPENAIISGPPSKQQTLVCTANIWRLVARVQKHSDYIDSASKSWLWKLAVTQWQMSPVFYHQNSPSSQNKLLKGSRCLSSKIV